jgi:hypothetical protein
MFSKLLVPIDGSDNSFRAEIPGKVVAKAEALMALRHRKANGYRLLMHLEVKLGLGLLQHGVRP